MNEGATRARRISARELELLNYLKYHGRDEVAASLRKVEEEVMYRTQPDKGLREATLVLRQVAERIGECS